ncbi:MAG: PfkB family carbohydrate kinase [Cellulomonadaceae bacterium]|nr:PfkB family carbohydrate kinase [Cellulomonadaceae bacterium]
MTVCWFVGLTTLDVVHRANGRPSANEKVTASRQDVAAGGPAANAAVTAAALGVDAVLVTALGTSPVAAAARADLETCGVTVVDTAAGAVDFPLAVSAVLVDDATGVRSVISADGALSVAPTPTADLLDGLPAPEVVLFDGHHPALTQAVLAWLDGRADDRPLVVLDAGRWRPIFTDLIPAADVVAASDDFTLPDDDHLVAGLFERGARGVVITHGPHPAEWHAGDGFQAGLVDIPEVAAVDTLGAGDAFHGALVAALASGVGLPSAVTSAVEVASTRVQHVGPRVWLNQLEVN